MPIYEYKCSCGKKKEVLKSITDESDEKCKCGKTMERQISLSSFKINGYAPSRDFRNET
jgi:putative FmdB family regulatory protein